MKKLVISLFMTAAFFLLASPADAKDCKFKKDDKVRVLWGAKWYKAKILDHRKGCDEYKVHYKGWSKKWDAWVSKANVKKR